MLKCAQYRQGVVWLWLPLLVALFDQLSKWLALAHLSFQVPKSIIPFFNFTLNYNRGIAFGMFNQSLELGQLLLLLLAVAVTLFMLGWLLKTPFKQKTIGISLSFIVGGAIGNIIDRVFRGHVVDFIDFHVSNWHFHTFNVADSFISVGAVLLIVHLLFFDTE